MAQWLTMWKSSPRVPRSSGSLLACYLLLIPLLLAVSPPADAEVGKSINEMLSDGLLDVRLIEATEALNLRRPREAEDVAAEYLRLQKSLGYLRKNPDSELIAYHLRAQSALALGRAELAIEHWRKGAEAGRRGGLELAAAACLVHVAWVQGAALDRPEDAQRSFRKALRSPEPSVRAEVWRKWAELVTEEGDVAEAMRLLEKARGEVEGNDTPEARKALASVGLDLARLWIVAGDNRTAVPLLLEARELLAGVTSSLLDDVLFELGNAYANQHDTERAREAFREAGQATVDTGQMVEALIEIARIETDAGNPDEADRLLEKAHKIADRRQLFSQLVEVSLERARAAMARGETEVALDLLKTVDTYGVQLFEGERAVDPEVVASITLEIANIMCEGGQASSARWKFGQALTQAEGLPHIQLEVLADRATCERSAGLLDEAEETLRAAAALLEEQRARVAGGTAERQRYLAFQATVGEALVEVLFDQGRFEEALLASEALKARTLVELLETTGAVRAGDVPPKLVERQLELTNGIAGLRREALTAESFAPARRKELEDLEGELADLRLEIAALQPENSPARALLEAGSADALAAALAPDEAALVYAVTDGGVLLFVLRGGELTTHRVGDPDELSRGVRRLRRYLRHPDEGYTRGLVVEREPLSDAATAAEVFGWVAGDLYRQLWAPAAPRLQGARRVVIVPDGFLHYLPFEVLALDDGRFLTEEVITSYSPSLTALRVLRDGQEAAGRPSTMFGVADPVFDGTGGSGGQEADALAERGVQLVQLPGTRAEAEAIQQHLPAAEFLFGSDAREGAVKAGVTPSHRYLHFATHGLVPDDVSWLTQPSLVLSLDDPGAGEDGLLDMGEIAGIEMDAEVVVLSACQTAVGNEVKGEGLLGLTRAFLTAGAHRVVASLWSVSDQATAELMGEFYGHLQEEPPAEALRAARLSTMDRYPHPYYWAAFVISGR